MSEMFRDLRYGCRMLRRSPGFTAIVVGVLALGIGANCAIFSLINAVLLSPPPYRDPASLFTLSGVNVRGEGRAVSAADVREFRRLDHICEKLAVFEPLVFAATGREGPENLYGFEVSSEWFDILGAPPALGRLFRADEFRPGAPGAVILSDRLWQRRFARDPGVIGRQILLNGEGYAVAGVMPPDFLFHHPSFELWTAWQVPPELPGGREAQYLSIVRLRPGVTQQQAQAHVDAVFRETAVRKSPNDFRTTLRPLGEKVAAQVSATLLVLFGAVGFVLLIACLNVANLLLARGAGRGHEIAVRTAMGAGRLRIVRLVLAESLLLAVLGGMAGLAVAACSSRILVAISPEGIPMPRLEQARLDNHVLLFTLLLSVLTGIAVGLVPALRASRVDMHVALKDAGRSATSGRRSHRLRSLLVVAEVALSVVLLTGAGLMLRSLDRLLQIDLGFDPGRVLTMRVPVPGDIKEMPQQARYITRMIERLQPLPGLNALGMTTVLPLGDVDSMSALAIEGRQAPGQVWTAQTRCVNAGYFRAMGIALRQGRVFNESDDTAALPVAVISETLARRYLPNENPVGRRVYIDGARTPVTIVGVVGDVKRGSVTESGQAELYRDYRQHLSPAFSTTLVLRTASDDPERLSAAVEREIRAFNPDQAIRSPRSMRQVVAESLSQPRFYTTLLGAFAAIALVLAAIGLYGVLSYSVSRRSHEIGIRMALGAPKRAIFRQVVGQALVLSAVGATAGLAGSWALTRLIAGILYQTSPTDPLTFSGVSLLLILVALMASWVPARRAMAVDPAVALRSE